MLIEIKSDVFREKNIKFHKGLNVVLGDEQASNSIGKSNLLLIVDFVFGGSTYITHSIDVIENIGNHSFYFTFEFDKKYRFLRSTDVLGIIYECSENYKVIENKSMKLEEFTNFLQKKYQLDYVDTTFRALVATYIRVWGIDNYDEKKPLKTYKNDSGEKSALNNLIKLFDKYTELKDINEEIDKNSKESSTITAMYKTNYAHKITKKEYKSNLIEIEDLNRKIKDIKENVLKYLVNTEELINKETIELKAKKNNLLVVKDKYENHLLKINKNLEYKSNISAKHIQKLEEFFPNVEIEKIDKIESFHKGIRKILSKEIKEIKKDLEEKISKIKIEIEVIDEKIMSYVKVDDKPNLIVNELLEYSTKIKELEKDNEIHKEKDEKLANLRTLNSELSLKVSFILEEIKKVINQEIVKINEIIDDKSNPPIFETKDNTYKLYQPNDTGTGTCKLNLIIFDLAILKLTKLPLLIHDSILFKDIGNRRIESLISYYTKFDKQIFIAIDEHKKYGNSVQILEQNKVIKLDQKNTLYHTIWSMNAN